MPGELTRAGQRKALDQAMADVTTYLALCTADPGKNPTVAGLAEISAAGYSRQAVTWGAASDADPAVKANSAQVLLGPFSGDPANATHAALVTSASGTGGEVRYKWTLDAAKDAAIGESIAFAIGALSGNLD